MKKYGIVCSMLLCSLSLVGSENNFPDIFSACDSLDKIQETALSALEEACARKDEERLLNSRSPFLIGFIGFLKKEFEAADDKEKVLLSAKACLTHFFECFDATTMSQSCTKEFLNEADCFCKAIAGTQKS